MEEEEAYGLIAKGLTLVPVSHYLLAFLAISLSYLYILLDFHLLHDAVSGFRGSRVLLTFHPSSPVYDVVVSKCNVLRGRYLASPWLSSPHLQVFFLHFFGRPPSFTYSREIFLTSDGGTIALDWLLKSDVLGGSFHERDERMRSRDDVTPIVVVIPGLASDSHCAYIKHAVFSMAKSGWNVVVSNHRGLGGVSITSDCFYNAGWTEDARAVIGYLQNEYPKAPLFAIGTSIGANILVKYLGEDGEKSPLRGAAAVCNPWDLLIGDRFICRTLVQKVYDRALTIGLQDFAKLHESHLTRLANWEGIKKSRSIRDFDNHATCHVGKFETVDTYYRRCSSSYYVGNVAVPLLCISALDDPLCTREAIPWDECRSNKMIVLATPKHGAHLAFFEGLTATSLWWVRAVSEFLGVLHSSPCMHVQKMELEKETPSSYALERSHIDQGPYVNVGESGMVAVMSGEQAEEKDQPRKHVRDTEREQISEEVSKQRTSKHVTNIKDEQTANHIQGKDGWLLWLLALIAVIASLAIGRISQS